MDISLARQAASFAGAMMILFAYVGHQLKRIDSSGALYNVLNAIGSAILAYIALRPFQVGFVVLESVWAVVSVYSFVRGRSAA